MSSSPAVFFAGVCVFVSLVMAAEGAQAAPAARKKTVAEILKQVDSESRGRGVQIKKASSALPSSRPVVAQPVSREKLDSIKPPKTSLMIRPEKAEEAELQKMTDQSIAELYKLAQKFRTSPNRGEIWLRLAEHYTDKARLIEYDRRDDYDKKMSDFDAGKTKRKPVLDLAPAFSYNDKAIELYEWFLRDFPRDPRTDQALYFLGYNFVEKSQLSRGVKYYERLTKEFPNSMYIQEAHFALGEHYFDNNQWRTAHLHYAAVAQNRRGRLYSFGLYKLAWCEYRLGNIKKAVQMLESVIQDSRDKASEAKGGGKQVSKIRLATEALKDIIRFYGEIGDPAKARTYFTRLAGEKALFSVLERLAYLYSDLGKREGARQMFKELLSMKPTAPKAFDYQYQIVLAYSGGDPNTFRSELYTWVRDYGPGSPWSESNKGDKEMLENAWKLRESTLRNNTLQLHKSAQDSKSPRSRTAAREGYDMYLRSFSDSSSLDEMRFFYAELLYDMGLFAEAGAQYQWVADNAPKSKYHEPSITNNLLALEKALPKEEEIRRGKGESIEPIPFPASVSNFEKASERYLKEYPRGQKASDVKFKIGRLHYAYNHFDEALKSFKEIVKTYPKTQNAVFSANLILDIFNLKKDYAGLIKEGEEMQKSGGMGGDTQAGSDISGVVEKAKFKQAQDFEMQKNYPEAAKEYDKFARENPKSDLATSARFNAAVNFERGGDLLAAIGGYGLVLASKDKKAEGLKERSRRLLGALYEKTGQYAEAAKEFEAAAAEAPKDLQSADLLYNAAVIRLALGDTNNAIKDFDKYSALTKKRDKVESHFLIAQHLEDRKQIAKAISYYLRYLNEGGSSPARVVESTYKVADLNEKSGNKTEAEKWYKKTIATQAKLKNAERGAWYAAESKFRLTQPMLAELKALKIPENQKKAESVLQKKLKLVAEIGKDLGDVVKYDSGDQVVSGLVLLAQANDHMYRAIEEAPVPKELPVDQVKEYKDGVSKFSAPFKEKAQENFNAALKKAHEVPAYNDWVFLALKGVEAYDQTRPRNVYSVSPVRIPASEENGNKELADGVKTANEGKVLDEAAKLLAANPKDLKALNAMVVTYLRNGRTDMAKLVLSRAFRDYPNDPMLHNNLGLILLSEKNEEAAIGEFRKALGQDESNWQASANLGTLHAKYLNYDAANVYLKNSFEKKGDDFAIGANYALSLMGIGRHGDSKDVFSKIKVEESKDAGALLNFAALNIQFLNEKTKGQEILNKIKYFTTDSDMMKKIRTIQEGSG